MAEDPYTQWLGMPPGPRPPKAHEILGIAADVDDPALIEDAAAKRMDVLDSYALSSDRKQRQTIQQLMNQVARARTHMVSTLGRQSASAGKKQGRQLPGPAKPAANKDNNSTPPRATPQQAQPPQPITAPPPLTTVSLSPRLWTILIAGWAGSIVLSAVLAFVVASLSAPDPVTQATPSSAKPPQQTPDQNQLAQTTTPNTPPSTSSESPTQTTPDTTTQPQTQATPQTQPDPQLAINDPRPENDPHLFPDVPETEKNPQPQPQPQPRPDPAGTAETNRRPIPAPLQGYAQKLNQLTGWDREKFIRQTMSQRNGFSIDLKAEVNNAKLERIDLSAQPSQATNGNSQGNARLTDFTALTGLSVKRLDLNYLPKLTTLDQLRYTEAEILNLYYCIGLQDISAIRDMRVSTLYIDRALFDDVEPLRGLELDRLTLENCESLVSIDALRGMSLDWLNINACRNLSDIGPLKDVQFKQLSFNSSKASDLSPIGARNLAYLAIGYHDNLRSLEGIAGTVTDRLSLSMLRNLADYSALSRVTVNEQAALYEVPIKDFTWLKGGVSYIQVNRCESLRSLRGLERLPIRTLKITKCPVPRSEVDRLKKLKPGITIIADDIDESSDPDPSPPDVTDAPIVSVAAAEQAYEQAKEAYREAAVRARSAKTNDERRAASEELRTLREAITDAVDALRSARAKQAAEPKPDPRDQGLAAMIKERDAVFDDQYKFSPWLKEAFKKANGLDVDLTAAQVSDGSGYWITIGRLNPSDNPSQRENVTDITPLTGLKVRKLGLGYCTKIKNLEVLQTMEVYDLDMFGFPEMDSLDLFLGMDGLKQLRIEGCAVSDLRPIRQTELTRLNVKNCKNIRSLDGLEGKAWESLVVMGCENLTQINALSRAKHESKGFSVSGTAVSDLTPLTSWSHLEYFSAADCPNLKSLAGLENMNKLNRLDIKGTPIPNAEIQRIRQLLPNVRVFR